MSELATGPANVGPDGEKIVDMTFYDLLDVRGDATELQLKKAYRKQAIRFHPDKNVGDDTAAAKFQEISEAFGVLSDSNLRAVYNKQGKNKTVAGAGEEFMNDPGAIFSSMFGGKAFMDWIGEISLGKDVSKAFEMGTTAEEKEKLAAELSGTPPATPSVVEPMQSTISHSTFVPPVVVESVSSPAAPSLATPAFDSAKASATTSTSFIPAVPSQPSTFPPPPASKPVPVAPASTRRTPEQRAQMEVYDRERAEEKRERIRMLAEKLLARIRPFVESTNPGVEGDAETKRFGERIREEAADLAMESFGVELTHLIGHIYQKKATNYIQLHRKPLSNLLGVPGFFSRIKEKTTMLKEGWSFLSVGLDVQSSMTAMQALESRMGDIDVTPGEGGQVGEGGKGAGELEAEMKRIEGELSGKLLLVAWKGSKFELGSVLRQVVDVVLSKEDPSVTDATLMLRAKAILLCGAILSSVVPDETDSERRELERMVEAANQRRKEKKSPKPKVVPVAAAKV